MYFLGAHTHSLLTYVQLTKPNSNEKLVSLLFCHYICIGYCFSSHIALILAGTIQKAHDISKNVTMVEEKLIPKDTVDSWDDFYLALTFVESPWNPEVLNPSSGALGLI